MTDTIYRLPLDEMTDNDLIDWIGSIPRNKKAEVIRHALRFYKSHLKEGEMFYYPVPSGEQRVVEQAVAQAVPKIGEKKLPRAGLRTITQIEDN